MEQTSPDYYSFNKEIMQYYIQIGNIDAKDVEGCSEEEIAIFEQKYERRIPLNLRVRLLLYGRKCEMRNRYHIGTTLEQLEDAQAENQEHRFLDFLWNNDHIVLDDNEDEIAPLKEFIDKKENILIYDFGGQWFSFIDVTEENPILYSCQEGTEIIASDYRLTDYSRSNIGLSIYLDILKRDNYDNIDFRGIEWLKTYIDLDKQGIYFNFDAHRTEYLLKNRDKEIKNKILLSQKEYELGLQDYMRGKGWGSKF